METMKRDIVLIANYWHFEFEKTSSRYRTMADTICASQMDIEVITSNFRHQTKTYRNAEQIAAIESPYKVTLLREPRYRKNISLRRIYSHHIFAREVVKYLSARKQPDLIIVSVPSLSVGSAVTKFAQKHGIKVIVDIQDLWPEAFRMAINIPVISDLLFAPMMIQANRIYSRADRIMAVSETYAKRGAAVNKNGREGLAVYIGTDSGLVERAVEGKNVFKPENEFWVGYVGAIGHSYDIKLIIDAIRILESEGISNIVFKVMGDGILMEEVRRYADESGINCHFTGFVEYGEMMCTLMACDLAVNPIVGHSVSSIINKVSDYAMAGIPVVNTQNSAEYRKLLDEYRCGINCENGNPYDVAKAIRKLYIDPKLKKQMGKNAERLARERFDRQKTYQRIVSVIENI